MSALLDTCLVSELVKARPDSRVVRWLDAQPEDDLFLSALTLGEIQKGVCQLPAGNKRERLQAWLEHDLCQRFTGRILDVTASVSRLWGQLEAQSIRSGVALGAIDGLLAATALVHGSTVITRNTKDFASTGVPLLNPWI